QHQGQLAIGGPCVKQDGPPGLRSVLRQYESVLLSLEDMAQTDASNTGVTARGLLERFGKADCVRTTLRAKRTEEKFQEIYSQATEKICMLNIEPISMPHIL
ncbi:hypothetical protein JOQ06_023859, partial [Pogonophryne albipinna]